MPTKTIDVNVARRQMRSMGNAKLIAITEAVKLVDGKPVPADPERARIARRILLGRKERTR